MPKLGYAKQGWQRQVRTGRPPPPPMPVDNTEADRVERCYVYLRRYHPQEMFAVKVYHVDNWDGESLSRDDMRKDMERKFQRTCSQRTFDRRRERGEELLRQMLEAT